MALNHGQLQPSAQHSGAGDHNLGRIRLPSAANKPQMQLYSAVVQGKYMSRSAVIGLTLCMLPILSVAAVPTPSFDCQRAQSPVEKTICQQAELAELDRQLNSAYWQFIKQLPNAQQETARQMQRNWIRAREQDCRQHEPSINWFTPEPASSYQEDNSANGENRLSECIKTYLNDQLHHLNKGIPDYHHDSAL